MTGMIAPSPIENSRVGRNTETTTDRQGKVCSAALIALPRYSAPGTVAAAGRLDPAMIELDLSDQIATLRKTFDDIRAVIGVDKLEAEIARPQRRRPRRRTSGTTPTTRRRSRAR